MVKQGRRGHSDLLSTIFLSGVCGEVKYTHLFISSKGAMAYHVAWTCLTKTIMASLAVVKQFGRLPCYFDRSLFATPTTRLSSHHSLLHFFLQTSSPKKTSHFPYLFNLAKKTPKSLTPPIPLHRDLKKSHKIPLYNSIKTSNPHLKQLTKSSQNLGGPQY